VNSHEGAALADRAATRGTVLIAGAANIFVGAIKLAAGIMVGSSAMLAEAAHSAADTLNQAFLLTSVHRGERPADQRHPMVGLGLAALGLALRQVTGSPVWDGGASIAIGALLVVVAVKLGLDSRDFLIGRAADPKELKLIRDEIESAPGVDALLDLRTMHIGPDHLIVAARVAFSDAISADRAEDVADDVDRRLADRLPQVSHVFLDPTQTSP